jgi:predicted transcriptional regulator
LSKPKKPVTVRFDLDQFDRVTALAAARNCTPSDIVREAVHAHLGGAAIMTSSQRRIARLSEYLQLAMDVIITEQYPEFRDRILSKIDQRLEQYHGA